MQTTRRKLFGSLLAVVAAPFAPKLQAEEEKPEVIIRAGDPGADNLEVYNEDTGEISKIVLAISLGRWIEIPVYGDPEPVRWYVNPITFEGADQRPDGSYPNYDIPRMRVPGNWQVRQKPAPKTDERVGKDFFGYKRKPAPFPVVYQEFGKS